MMLRQLLRSGATPSLANPRGAAPKWTSTPGSHVRHGFGPPEYVDVCGRNAATQDAHTALRVFISTDDAEPGSPDNPRLGPGRPRPAEAVRRCRRGAVLLHAGARGGDHNDLSLAKLFSSNGV